MDTLELFSTLMKIFLAAVAYLAVLGLGILSAWWMGRRERRRGGTP